MAARARKFRPGRIVATNIQAWGLAANLYNMNVWYLVFRPESLTYTVAKALSYGGHDVFIWVVDPMRDEGAPDGIRNRIREIPRVKIVARDYARLPDPIDRLVVQAFPRPTESLRDVGPLARRARNITLITAGDCSRAWRDAMQLQWFELRKVALHAHKIDRVLFKDGFYPYDLFGSFKHRRAVGFDVHSQFLHDSTLFHAMHARDWNPETRRPIRVNFLGSRDPPARECILDTLRPMFPSASGGSGSAVHGKIGYWHEYSDAAPIGLDPLEFVSVLSRSDFTLCPRGYSLVTHRPLEALLRGSIPVLSANELGLYGIDLIDGTNCIGVPDGQWSQALRQVARTEERMLIQMRINIHAMFETDLRYDVVSKRIRIRLGVED